VASSMEAQMRGSQAEAPAPPITQVPVGVVDRKKDMTETLTRRLQGHKMDPKYGVELKAESQIIIMMGLFFGD
jgi:hypothetical protein